jgi:hypothetical protein
MAAIAQGIDDFSLLAAIAGYLHRWRRHRHRLEVHRLIVSKLPFASGAQCQLQEIRPCLKQLQRLLLVRLINYCSRQDQARPTQRLRATVATV